MTTNTKPVNVLAKYYPRWHANCVESARWLRSGKEYEEWHENRGLQKYIVSSEQREIQAAEYDKRAANYANPDYTGA